MSRDKDLQRRARYTALSTTLSALCDYVYSLQAAREFELQVQKWKYKSKRSDEVYHL